MVEPKELEGLPTRSKPELQIGERYWTYYLNEETGYSQVIETKFENSIVDRIRINDYRVFPNQQAANQNLQEKKFEL